MKTKYTVHNSAGGQIATTESLERALYLALTSKPCGPGYVLDADEQRIDLSPWDLEYDADGAPYLVDAEEV